jgi:hypothetical protein
MNGLPGRILNRDLTGQVCYFCDEGNPAVIAEQGETDSFGYEVNYLCQSCVDKPSEPWTGRCDYCKKGPFPLQHTRDYDEGMSGPVYQVCATCKAAQDQRDIDEWFYMRHGMSQDEWDELDPVDDDDDYPDDDDDEEDVGVVVAEVEDYW